MEKDDYFEKKMGATKDPALKQLSKAQEQGPGQILNEIDSILLHFTKKSINEKINFASEYFYEVYLENFERYHSLIKPDISGNIFHQLYSIDTNIQNGNFSSGKNNSSKMSNNDERLKATHDIMVMIGDLGHEINGAKLYQKFMESRQGGDDAKYNLLFLNALNELKYLGFLNETKKEKFTMIKTIFAKSRVIFKKRNTNNQINN